MAKEIIDKRKEQLLNLMLDSECLEKLNKHTTSFSIFKILRMENAEIRHSNMLGWLFDSKGSHGLASMGLRIFLEQIISSNLEFLQLMDIDLSKMLLESVDSFFVRREYYVSIPDKKTKRNKRCLIDIVLISNNTKQLIAIENKIESTQNEGQLASYTDALEKDFPDYQKILLYLTPNDAESIDEDKWLKISYEPVLNMLDKIDTKPLTLEVKMIIEQYKELIRRNVMGIDDEVKELCKSIYEKHKAALDLIFEYRPDEGYNFAEAVRSIVKEIAKTSSLGITINEKICDKNITRFSTRELENLIDNNSKGLRNYVLIYEIVHDLKSTSISLCAQLYNRVGEEKLRDKIHNISQAHYKEFNVSEKKPGKSQSLVFIKQVISLNNYNGDLEKLINMVADKLSGAIENELSEFESTLKKEWDNF